MRDFSRGADYGKGVVLCFHSTREGRFVVVSSVFSVLSCLYSFEFPEEGVRWGIASRVGGCRLRKGRGILLAQQSRRLFFDGSFSLWLFTCLLYFFPRGGRSGGRPFAVAAGIEKNTLVGGLREAT